MENPSPQSNQAESGQFQNASTDLNSIFNQIPVVSSVPTHVPRKFSEQFRIYVSVSTYRFYWYDVTNATWRYSAAFPISESDIILSDVTTNDVSTTKHGFVPKAPNDTTKFLRGDGAWATAGGATKELFIPVTVRTASQASPTFPYTSNANIQGYHSYAVLTSSQEAVFTFKIPSDFTSLSNVEVIMNPDATETITFDVDTSFGAIGESAQATVGTAQNQTLAVTANVLTACDINLGTAFTGIAANDYIAVLFGSDTSDLRVLGLRFKYT